MTSEERKREVHRKAKRKYKQKIRRLAIELYPTEQDIIDKIDSVPQYATYIKGLIRADISANKAPERRN